MESQKYLIIITLIDGQNFIVPEGAPDKIEASVFAEARFGNESLLTSDPIKLTNSNPEFVTELAWQLDKRSLHQMRVERKSIKLQVFLQTREKTKSLRNHREQPTSNGVQPKDDSNATHKVELIGYTVIDIRSAQETELPKFRWLPLLNPKFRKSSYNRPEIQLALTLSRIEDETTANRPNPLPSTSTLNEVENTPVDVSKMQFNNGTYDDSIDDKLYKTCLDFTVTPDKDEIIENDITIRAKDGSFYIYDIRDSVKHSIDDCDEKYNITITIPFTSDLETLVKEPGGEYYFSVSLFGTALKTECFRELTSVETKEVKFTILTTHSSLLITYFELNSSLIIKLHQVSGEIFGIATIQLDQLCSLDTKKRSIEGIFALQSMSDHDIPSAIHPSLGVSITLHKDDGDDDLNNLKFEEPIEMVKEHFGNDIDDYLTKSFNNTHQLTFETSNIDASPNPNLLKDDRLPCPTLSREDHHFCFVIDFKSFSYNSNQRLIPTLRELFVRFSYPFFGYEDSYSTDASMPISPSKSIIVNGYFELNFATSAGSLLTAFREIPLELEILKCDEFELKQENHVVATSHLNLAQTLCLGDHNVEQLIDVPISTTVSLPTKDLDARDIGEIQIYLSLKDLGKPKLHNSKALSNNSTKSINNEETTLNISSIDCKEFDTFILEAKSNFDTWKEEYFDKLSNDVKVRENERFKKIYRQLEAKEAKREQEFRKKIEELSNVEKRFKNSLAHIESLEKKLSNSFEQLKTRDASLDTRLDIFELKISKAINNIKLEYEKRLDSLSNKHHRLSGDNLADSRVANHKQPTKFNAEISQPRRSSLKNPINNSVGIPLPVRSSSLVRGPGESLSTRIVKRSTGVVTTVVNGVGSRQRSNSTRLNLSKETQEKLASLRKEKAELLKRGCRPNDELIQEINSLIEKLAC